MRSFSVAFAKEVRDRGIRVTAVCPAGVATDLYGLTPRWQRIGKRLGVLITPDNCARRGLRALWRGRRCIVPDWCCLLYTSRRATAYSEKSSARRPARRRIALRKVASQSTFSNAAATSPTASGST